MAESLYDVTKIKVLGRVMPEIVLHHPEQPEGTPAPSPSLLLEAAKKNNAKFARVYGYVYEGVFTEITRPMLLLVHGSGQTIDDTPSLIDNQGLALRDWDFSGDLRIWTYDRADFSLCLNIDSGPIGALLGGAAGSAGGQDVRAGGQDVRAGGQDVRMGGQDVRMGGQDVRMGGQDMRARSR